MTAMRRLRVGAAALLVLWTVTIAPRAVRATAGRDEDRPPRREGGRREDTAAPPAIVERATSELVLIETYVTDAGGRPIRGLSAEDFTLVVDARKQAIASVEFRESGPASAPAPAPTAVAAAGTGTPLSAEPASPWSRRFVLFFEDGTSGIEGMTMARRAADRFLESALGPTDQIALAAYDRRLKILHDFTTDREALRRALAASFDDPMRRSDFGEIETARLGDFEDALAGGRFAMAASIAVNQCFAELPRFRDVTQAVRSLVDSLAPWRGYKAIIFMGDGFPENPAAPYFDALLRRGGPDAAVGADQCSLRSDLRSLTEATAAAGVAVHTIQTTGLGAFSARPERRAGRFGSAGNVLHGDSLRDRRSNALEALALNTGGSSSTSNDMLGALKQAEETSRAYYVLGYVPEGPPDGRYHSVIVRCRRGGARIRWRRGFTRLLPEEARARALEAAYLLPDLYPGLDLDLATVAGPRGGGERTADLVLHLPAGSLLFLPVAGRPTARLTAGFVSIDATSREVLRVARSVTITVPPGAGAADTFGINLFSRVRLPSTAQAVTAVVSDESGGIVGGRQLRLPASPASEEEVYGLSIYSLDEQSLWVEVGPGSPKEDGQAAAEATVGPALKTVFDAAETMACAFRMPPAGAPAARSLRLVVMQGSEVVRAKPLDLPEGRSDVVKTPLPAAGLASGSYALVVEEIVGGQVKERARTSFRVR